MTWIKFSERKPKGKINLITRAPAWEKGESFIDLWRIWDESIIEILPHPFTHWWDGEDNIELAHKEWESKPNS